MDDNHNYISDEDLAAFLDGNVSGDEVARILAAIAGDSETAETLSLASAVGTAIEAENRKVLPMLALAAANRQNLCSFDCEMFVLRRLGLNVDHWSLLETAKANNWVREAGTPLHHVGRLLELKGLHVERKYDASVADLTDALARQRQVIAIVDRNMIEGTPAERASYHAVYVTGADGDSISYLEPDSSLEQAVGRDVFTAAWRCSGNYIVTATPTVAGYIPRPIDVGDIDLDDDLVELTEAIAENAHDTWARARMDEGWTYGPVRDDSRRTHPDLVPYAKLPESEKEYDRIMAMNTLRLVRRLGFDIINRNN